MDTVANAPGFRAAMAAAAAVLALLVVTGGLAWTA
jgi:hypothetical protein